MAKGIAVIDIGAKVTVAESIQATVTAVSIRNNYRVFYECTWWDDRTRKCEWLEEFEVEPMLNQRMIHVGFKDEFKDRWLKRLRIMKC